MSPPKLTPYPTDVGTAMTGPATMPADDARQGALHPGDDDDDARPLEDVALVKEAMDAGDADVVHALDARAEHAQRLGALLGHRQVARARADQRHRPRAEGRDGGLLQRRRARELLVLQLGQRRASPRAPCPSRGA